MDILISKLQLIYGYQEFEIFWYHGFDIFIYKNRFRYKNYFLIWRRIFISKNRILDIKIWTRITAPCCHVLLFILYFWLRITDEGSVPEMRIWSKLLIKSVLKWCIHLRRSLFLYLISENLVFDIKEFHFLCQKWIHFDVIISRLNDIFTSLVIVGSSSFINDLEHWLVKYLVHRTLFIIRLSVSLFRYLLVS